MAKTGGTKGNRLVKVGPTTPSQRAPARATTTAPAKRTQRKRTPATGGSKSEGRYKRDLVPGTALVPDGKVRRSTPRSPLPARGYNYTESDTASGQPARVRQREVDNATMSGQKVRQQNMRKYREDEAKPQYDAPKQWASKPKAKQRRMA